MSDSGQDAEEPMDCSSAEDKIQQHPTSHVTPAEAEKSSSLGGDEALLALSFRWTTEPQKLKIDLQRVLQTWFSKSTKDCTVIKVSRDGRALIKITPAADQSVLEKLVGQTLNGKSGNTVIIESVHPATPELEEQIQEEAPTKPPGLMSEPLAEKEQLGDQSSAVSAAGQDTCTCYVPVSHFWYVNHIYKEEIKRIEKENGVKIMSDVKVTFTGDQKDANPEKALSEYTNLVQQCLPESDGSVIPLKFVDPDQWSDALKIVQKKENKLVLTLSSQESTVCGPRLIRQGFSKYLDATQKSNTKASLEEREWQSQDTSWKINMTIKDPLVDAGLTMEESHWEQMMTSFSEDVAKIKAKFDVDFKVSNVSKEKVKVKPLYKRAGGNTALESHAGRALLRLYQKSVTKVFSVTQLPDVTGSSGTLSHFNDVYQFEGASSGLVLNGESAYGMRSTETPTTGGATAGDSKDEQCPICMEAFTNKKQLKCKHEFCYECLQQAKSSMGPICPVCKDVFGVMEGDQPDGRMTSYTTPLSIPGFPNCGTIVIDYDIPGGKQTNKHPKPGQLYSGVKRTAYLPDNREGKEVLELLQRAFNQKLIFTIGTSRTTGMDNQVTWNDIHHKTSITGGPQSFGYPDPDYLSRVREELKAKGIE